jgi:hypothetical protein
MMGMKKIDVAVIEAAFRGWVTEIIRNFSEYYWVALFTSIFETSPFIFPFDHLLCAYMHLGLKPP